MARRLLTAHDIDVYVASVIVDANHHAAQVAAVIQPLSDEVRARLGPTDTIDVYERNGITARTCWVKIAGKRYCFSYNYKLNTIELRDGSTQGSLRYTFTNATTLLQIQAQAAAL